MKYLSNLNLNKNELQNAKIQNLATPPADPVAGQIYYNTVDNVAYVYNGTNFISAAGATIIEGNGIDVTPDGQQYTISHEDTSTQASIAALTAQNVIESITLDTFGHITAITTRDLNLDLTTGAAADSGTGDFSTSNTLTIAGGTDVNTAWNDSTKTFTVNHDTVSKSTTTSAASPAFAGTFDVVDSITTSAQGHITAVNTKTVTVPTETTLSVVDEGTGAFLTDATASDHAITLSRSNSTEATITVGELVVSAAGAGSGDVTIAGNLTVNGTTTTINTATVEIEDNIIEINSSQTGTPATSLVGGLQINRGDSTDYQLVFVEETDDFRIGAVGDLQPVLTRDETTNLVDADVLVWEAAEGRAIGKTPVELGLSRKFVKTIETADLSNATATITHNLNTKDIVVSLREVATDEIVYATYDAATVNTLEIKFAVAPDDGDFIVTIIG
jgi:hypothetical protein